MIKILFICHGNICRSPMAEFILKDMVSKLDLSDEFVIASSATSTEEIPGPIGNPIYPPAKAELRRQGIPFDEHHAIQLTKADYDIYDMIICMDSYNEHGIKRIIGSDPQKKVHRLMEYTDRGGDVADPWFTDRFDIAFRDIRDGCEGLLRSLHKRK